LWANELLTAGQKNVRIRPSKGAFEDLGKAQVNSATQGLNLLEKKDTSV
jgi:hypothetical protein